MQRFGDELNTPLEERGVAPYQWKLPFIDTAQAQVEQATDEGTFPTLSRAFQLEFGSQQGFQPLNEIYDAARGIPAKKGDSRERISIEQAKTEFPGLEIAPLFTDTITRGYANYLYQRKAKNQVRDMKAAQGNPAVGFAAGVGASLVDPVDMAINLTLSGVGAAKYAHTALKAGRLPSYSAAQRYYRMYQSNSILNNGIVSGAVEGFAGAAATEPLYQASKRATEGRVDLAQSAASLAISPLVGGVVGGLSDYLTRTPVAKRKDVPNPSIFDQPSLELRATMNAAEGEPIRAVDSINVPEQRQKLSDAEKQVTSKIEELDNYSGGLKPPLATVTPAVAQAVKKPVDVAPGFPIVGGVVTSRYGVQRPGHRHKGVDVGAPAGTPINTHIGGVVEVVKTTAQSGGYGNQVIIRQDDGYLVSYAHNKVNLVKPGQRIKPGTVIAEVGSTGRSTGPHTHIEVTGPDGKLVDPEKYFGNTAKKGGVKAEGRELKPAAQVEVSKKEAQRLQAEIAKLEEQLAKTPEAAAEIEVTERKLTAQVEKQVKAIREKYAKRKQEVKQKPFQSRGSIYDSKEKQLYALGIRESAEVRQAIQGGSLEDLSDVGGLTKTELYAAIKKEASNYTGKAVIVEGKPATVVQPAFGKVKVIFKDGTEKTVAKESVIPVIKPTPKPTVQEVKVKKPNPEAQTQLDKRKALEAQIEKRRQALSEAEAKATEAEKQLAEAAPEEAGPPVRPGEVDSIVDHPAVQNFMTPVEEALLNAPVREFPARVEEIINGLREDFAEYQAIPRRKGSRDEARLEALHQKMAEDWGSFQALVPAAQRMELPAFDKRSQMISPKNLERMSEQLSAFTPETVFDSAGQFNEMGVSELRNWYTTKNAELKAAYTKVKNANYKPETIKKNKEIIAELASDVDVAFLRLRQLGVTDIEPDAVSTEAFRSVLAEQNPGIAALLQETDSPVPYYQTKRQILENVKERIAAARQMVENAEAAPKAKHINSINFDGYDEAVQRLETDGKITDILAAQQEQLTSIQKDIDQMVQFQLIKESEAEHLRTKLQNDAPTLSDAEIDTAVRQIGIFCQNEKGG